MTMVFKSVSDLLGISETALRLLAGLLFTPVFAILYRKFILNVKANAIVHHLYFTIVGLSICYFCYGWHTVYILASLIAFYVILRLCELLKSPHVAPVFIFPYSMSVLLAGYVVYSTDEYDVNWTTVQCVVTLKMISVAFDWSDGQKNDSQKSAHQKEASLKQLPSLVEILGYSFYFGGLQGGPTFQFRRYQEFTDGTLFSHPIPSSTLPAVIQFLKAICYLAQNVLMDMVFPDKYVYSDDLDGYHFLVQVAFNAFWLRKVFTRYVGIWLLADVSCVLSGMAYNGKDEKSQEDRWDGMCAVKPLLFETGCTTQSFIDSFNIWTNRWVINYIFKRLRYFNSRLLSSSAVLLFLSIWHGFHRGYFLCFLCTEMPVVMVEKQVIDICTPFLPPWQHMGIVMKTSIYCIGMCYKFVATSTGMIAFVLLDTQLIIKGWAKTYYFVHVFLLVWFCTKFFAEWITKFVRRNKDKKL